MRKQDWSALPVEDRPRKMMPAGKAITPATAALSLRNCFLVIGGGAQKTTFITGLLEHGKTNRRLNFSQSGNLRIW